MFGMGFTEIVMILIVAILFLGPDKLPEAMVQIAKFIGSVKRTIDEAKSSFEEEVHLKELKEEAMGYRRELDVVKEDISGFKNSIEEPITQLNSEIESIRHEYDNSRYDRDIFDEISNNEAKVSKEQENEEKVEESIQKNEDSDIAEFKNLSAKRIEKDV